MIRSHEPDGAVRPDSAELEADRRFKLQPADPFDLIRWLARTQSDPRKAVAELVQNSIDARALSITVERRRLRGHPALIIRDDGQGVLPGRARDEALRHIATHIGHSHKLGLSASERHARVMAGKYGVGLLGFWALGRGLELRSRIGGSATHVLSLLEDCPTATISRIPVRLDAPYSFTEVVVYELHERALRLLMGRRLADYLAAELRGAILQSGVALEVQDHLARGLAQKSFRVTPRRFDGVRLDLPAEIAVESHAPIRVELYLARGADRSAIQLACAGTLVADNIAEVAVLGFTDPPWCGREVTGIIDFDGFQVPPGTRRGVVPNAAAAAFASALAEFEPLLAAQLGRLERARRAASDENLVDELRRAMRGLRERLPLYDLPDVEGNDGMVGAAVTGLPIGEGAGLGEVEVPQAQPELFAAGPLFAVSITPPTIAVPVGGERRVHAKAVDADGRIVRDGVHLEWHVDRPGLVISGEGPRPALAAAGDLVVGCEARLCVVARQEACEARALASVTVVARRERQVRGRGGIPRPELVDAPGAPWRSRMIGGRWEVNAGHEDYVALGDGRARVRYLVALLGKEIVARTYALPGAGELLEHLVAVMAHAERNLRAP